MIMTFLHFIISIYVILFIKVKNKAASTTTTTAADADDDYYYSIRCMFELITIIIIINHLI